jgi:hypothetical protein
VRQLSHDLRSDPLEGMFKGGCLRTSLACLRSLEWVITSATLLSFCCDLGERFFSFLFFFFCCDLGERFLFFSFFLFFFFWKTVLGPRRGGTDTSSIPAVARSATSAARSTTPPVIARLRWRIWSRGERDRYLLDILSAGPIPARYRRWLRRPDRWLPGRTRRTRTKAMATVRAAATPVAPVDTSNRATPEQSFGHASFFSDGMDLLRRHGLLSRRSSTVHPSFRQPRQLRASTRPT